MPKPMYNKEAFDERMEEFYGSQGKYGIMYSEDYEWSNRECVRRAYGDSRKHDLEGRSLAFHTPLLEKSEALECIREMPQYNAFDPEKVALQLAKMPEGTEIAVGRECSPVLYIWTDRPEMLKDLFKELENMKENEDDWTRGPDELGEVSRENRELSRFHYPEDADSDKVLMRAWWD